MSWGRDFNNVGMQNDGRGQPTDGMLENRIAQVLTNMIGGAMNRTQGPNTPMNDAGFQRQGPVNDAGFQRGQMNDGGFRGQGQMNDGRFRGQGPMNDGGFRGQGPMNDGGFRGPGPMGNDRGDFRGNMRGRTDRGRGRRDVDRRRPKFSERPYPRKFGGADRPGRGSSSKIPGKFGGFRPSPSSKGQSDRVSSKKVLTKTVTLFDAEVYCEACDRVLPNQKNFESHQLGFKHKSAVKKHVSRNKIVFKHKCQLCLGSFQDWEAHKELTTHKINFVKKKIEKPLHFHDKVTGDTEEPEGVEYVAQVTGYYCRICKRFYTDEEAAKVKHCKTKEHVDLARKEQSKKKLETELRELVAKLKEEEEEAEANKEKKEEEMKEESDDGNNEEEEALEEVEEEMEETEETEEVQEKGDVEEIKEEGTEAASDEDHDEPVMTHIVVDDADEEMDEQGSNAQNGNTESVETSPTKKSDTTPEKGDEDESHVEEEENEETAKSEDEKEEKKTVRGRRKRTAK